MEHTLQLVLPDGRLESHKSSAPSRPYSSIKGLIERNKASPHRHRCSIQAAATTVVRLHSCSVIVSLGWSQCRRDENMPLAQSSFQLIRRHETRPTTTGRLPLHYPHVMAIVDQYQSNPSAVSSTYECMCGVQYVQYMIKSM